MGLRCLVLLIYVHIYTCIVRGITMPCAAPTCTCLYSACLILLIYLCTVRVKKSPVSVPFRFSSRFNRSVPFRFVHFHSNRLPRANSFSARHEFVCKIHCVRWRSIARLFSTTRSLLVFSTLHYRMYYIFR